MTSGEPAPDTARVRPSGEKLRLPASTTGILSRRPCPPRSRSKRTTSDFFCPTARYRPSGEKTMTFVKPGTSRTRAGSPPSTIGRSHKRPRSSTAAIVRPSGLNARPQTPGRDLRRPDASAVPVAALEVGEPGHSDRRGQEQGDPTRGQPAHPGTPGAAPLRAGRGLSTAPGRSHRVALQELLRYFAFDLDGPTATTDVGPAQDSGPGDPDPDRSHRLSRPGPPLQRLRRGFPSRRLRGPRRSRRGLAAPGLRADVVARAARDASGAGAHLRPRESHAVS